MISIEEFETIYNLIPGEPEFELWFDKDGPSYMIIKYADCATFQRCGDGLAAVASSNTQAWTHFLAPTSSMD